MRKWTVVLLAAAWPAFAQAPGGFAMQAPITPAGQASLQRFALPFEAYRDARRDFADVRVLDGNREPVPIALAGEADLRPEMLPALALPLFPVSSLESTAKGGTDVTVRTSDGTLVEVRRRSPSPLMEGRGGGHSRAAAYILDASKVEEPIQALAFDWEAKPGTQVVKMRVEGSDDLKGWSFVGAGPIVRLQNGAQELSQPRVEFGARKAKYLRVTWDAPGFSLAGVRAERAARTVAPTRLVRVVTATPGEKPGEWRYDLGASLPVEAVRLVPAQSNDVAAASILARDDEKQPWRQVAWAPFYRIQVEGAEKQSPPLEIGKLPARYWLARLAAGSSTPPTLEATWRGVQMVFVMRGEGPFTLAFGNPKAASTAFPVASIIPEYKRKAELALPEAKVGAVAPAPPPTQWERLTEDVQPRRIALWAVLLIGVGVLGFMAWRLSRQAGK